MGKVPIKYISCICRPIKISDQYLQVEIYIHVYINEEIFKICVTIHMLCNLSYDWAYFKSFKSL